MAIPKQKSGLQGNPVSPFFSAGRQPCHLKKRLCTKHRLILWSADVFQIVKRRVKGGIVPLRPNVGFGDCRLSGLCPFEPPEGGEDGGIIPQSCGRGGGKNFCGIVPLRRWSAVAALPSLLFPALSAVDIMRDTRGLSFLCLKTKNGLPLDKNGFMLIQEHRSRIVRFKNQEDKP